MVSGELLATSCAVKTARPQRRARKPSIALVAQGIEHRFPKPNYGPYIPPRKPSKFLATARKGHSLKAVREFGNHPLFPIIPGDCCAEVVLGIMIDLAN